MSYIPAENFKDPAQALLTLEFIDALGQIIPKQSEYDLIPDRDRLFLTYYNRRSLNRNLRNDNIEEEVEKLHRSREMFEEMGKVKQEYARYGKNVNAINNRFLNGKKKAIPGVGVDGSGDHPKNFTQQRNANVMVQQLATDYNSWEALPGDQEDMLRENIGNVIYWQSSNFSQLPIGTPVELCSAAIELFSLGNPGAGGFSAITNILGDDLLRRRVECVGLKYLLEGNKVDLDDRSFDGINYFQTRSFRRFFYDAGGGAGLGFNLKTGYGDDSLITISSSTTTEIMNGDFRKNLAQLLTPDSILLSTNRKTVNSNKSIIGAILLVYSIFFSYICYVYHLYNELIDRITDNTLKDQYKRARLESYVNFLNLVNFAINKKFFNGVENTDIIVGKSTSDGDAIPGDACSAAELFGTVTGKYKIINDNELKAAMDSFGLNSINGNIIVGFKDNTTYTKICKERNINMEMFRPENYPIVFVTNRAGTPEIVEVDYRQTIERLTNFLLMDKKGSLPKKNGELITCGAPFQNEELLQATGKVLSGFYTGIARSKSLYLNYMEMKVNIFKSGVPAGEVIALRDYLLNQFNLIATTMATPQQKDLECLKLVEKIVDQYDKLRREEVRLTDDKTILVEGMRRRLGEALEDYPKQLVRAMRRVHSGVEAVVRLEVAKLTEQLYKNRNPGAALCTNFVTELDKRVKAIDDRMNEDLKKLMERKSAEIEKKYGPNAVKSMISSAQLINFGTIPATPQAYLQAVANMFATITGRAPTGVTPSAPGALGKKGTTLEQRLRVEQRKFWEDLRTSFSGKSVFLPVIQLDDDGVFEDSGFYLVDVIKSMILERLIAFKLQPLHPKTIESKVRQAGYIMFGANTADIGNPAKWRGINYKTFKTILRTDDDGVTRFRRLEKARDVMFNLLANGGYLTDSLTISLPEASNVSLALVKYCQNVLKKEVDKCPILISRQQFGQTVQPRMEQFTGTKGVDMISGTAYIEVAAAPGVGENDIVKR